MELTSKSSGVPAEQSGVFNFEKCPHIRVDKQRIAGFVACGTLSFPGTFENKIGSVRFVTHLPADGIDHYLRASIPDMHGLNSVDLFIKKKDLENENTSKILEKFGKTKIEQLNSVELGQYIEIHQFSTEMISRFTEAVQSQPERVEKVQKGTNLLWNRVATVGLEAIFSSVRAQIPTYGIPRDSQILQTEPLRKAFVLKRTRGQPVEFAYEGKYLGKGGCGKVVKMRSILSNTPFAAKIPNNAKTREENQWLRGLLVREVDFLKSVASDASDGVQGKCEIVEVPRGNQANDLWMLGPYYNRGDLRNLIKKRISLNEEELLFNMHRLADANDTAQEKGVLHKDIKPDNIFIQEEDGRHLFYLGDWGNANTLEAEFDDLIDPDGHQVGYGRTSTHYPAQELQPFYERARGNVAFRRQLQSTGPSQVLARTLLKKTDVFQLGITYAQLITGSLGFNFYNVPAGLVVLNNIPLAEKYDAFRAAAHERFPTANIAEEVIRLVESCAASSQVDRPTAKKLKRELKRIQNRLVIARRAAMLGRVGQRCTELRDS